MDQGWGERRYEKSLLLVCVMIAIEVVRSSLAFVLNLLTLTYDFEFRSVLLKTLIPFSPVCSSLQQMYFYFERFNFLFV